ncbi:glucose-6-phosphate isomerase [Shimia sp.]|uniref:glucose-6-phosphate isomerase n=1 Tax=Shimia sp. TaxID=1954381 RepID=UPI0035616C82
MFSKLLKIHSKTKNTPLADLFRDPDRAKAFSARADGLLLDFSKTGIDAEALAALMALVEQRGVVPKRDAMLRGERVNTTENRPALHSALRCLGEEDPAAFRVAGEDILASSRQVYARQRAFADGLRSGAWQGSGGPITDVVNIGIGGSDLGPAMSHEALLPYADGPRCHFVSNVDGADLHDRLRGLEAPRTLVIVASKTFTTQETMMNARAARHWMAAHGGDPQRQFVAISTARNEAQEFGISPENIFGFEDWVGGRYSIWGPIGLSLMLAIGPGNFADFLRGGRAMDLHFATAEPARNLPVLLALVGLWHHKVCGHPTRAVCPYEARLARLPAYLQQLEMESNGKDVGLNNAPLAAGGGPVVWGAPGTNGQHAFFQLLHQGREVVPVEFLAGVEGHEADLADHHRALLGNCLAQSEALLRGRTFEEAAKQLVQKGFSEGHARALAPHRVCTGNRPSTTLLYPRLTPFVLGQIIALYEHRVFVEAAILGLNPFDQWGVELGKEMAASLVPALSGGDVPQDISGSTRLLLDHIMKGPGASS